MISVPSRGRYYGRLLASDPMQISVRTDGKRAAFKIALLTVLGLYIGLATRELLANWLASRGTLSSLRTASRLAPGNADYRYRLGRYYELIARDETAAISQFSAAVGLNPHNARYWLDLAEAYQVTGNAEQQVRAVEQAIAAAPTDPDVAWYSANLYIALGQPERALRELRVVLESSPERMGPALTLCWRLNQDVHSLLQGVLPPRADVYSTFLDFLMARSRSEDSLAVWDGLVALGQPISMQKAFDYIRYLILQRLPEDATHVWWQAASRNGDAAYLPSSNNLLVNGDFSLDVLNGGFDWQYHKQQGVTLTLDPVENHTGHRSLSIAFDGPGMVDAGIAQIIFVHPNTTYEFSAYYKNAEIEGAGGPHFALQDLYDGTTFFQSEVLKEAPDWRQVSGRFTTVAETKLLVLRIRRLPESSPIRGKLWLSDFRLTLAPQAEGEAKSTPATRAR
jgi:tetratricopeptide (TPR) repeat protein